MEASTKRKKAKKKSFAEVASPLTPSESQTNASPTIVEDSKDNETKSTIELDATALEQLFNRFHSIVTLTGIKKLCKEYEIPIANNANIKSLQHEVRKKFGKEFKSIREEKLKAQEMKKNEIYSNYTPRFKHYVIIDFECTCWGDKRDNKVQEIIEFPAVLVDAKRKIVVDTFKQYVKPTVNPVLSEFCIDLTGITQAKINKAKSFPEVLDHFLDWLEVKGLTDPSKYLIITDGRFDIPYFLNTSLAVNDLPFPHQLRHFADLKLLFERYHPGENPQLRNMLDYYGIDFEGQQHCGIDDAKNIAKLVMKMCGPRRQIYPTTKMVSQEFSNQYQKRRKDKFAKCGTNREPFVNVVITRSAFKSGAYLDCDDCLVGSCEAETFYE